ncbi:AGE family epimerase/isomerase [Ollibium composti]|uniref:Mannose-1-phosphate guanylyltransferase n=1 Tax=Ollibium composti TaxID=2675109 RepID=A0ABY2Q5K1_9HYPH|nr:AGE family epimerase/isomerase [Mesorhizobium composti]THF56632.1 mannose-1-phosphate guanylyltransferase [Mesorhizobium composti]
MNEQVVCFVLAGGAGTRLWPLSRPEKPKQFHDLCGAGTMLARTLHRLKGRPEGATPLFVIAAERHAALVHREVAEIDLAGGVLLEQRGRDTAAAVALATLETLRTFDDSLMLIAPSDHEISTVGQFWETVESGIPAANAGRVVLFGVEPQHADTGYGYIEAGERHGDVFGVRRFIEKPGRETAERFVRDGGFLWNAGIFLFHAETMRRAFQALQPALWAAVEQAFQAATGEKAAPRLSIDYGDIPAVSFDRAIIERLDNLALVLARFAWTDLGSWEALLAAAGPDENGNVFAGDVAAIDCRGSYLSSEGRHLSVAGAEHLAIVSTPDAVFVAPVGRKHEMGRAADSVRYQGLLPEPTRTELIGTQRWGHWRPRVRRWLFEQALPLWANVGPDRRHGGFYEAIGFDGDALDKPKRMRTMARQVYAFAAARRYGWDGPADQLIDQGLAFISRQGRTAAGGWVRALDADGTVLDPVEDSYDQACVLLALAEAHRCGHPGALALCHETLVALDVKLRTAGSFGYLDASDADPARRRSNPHMHLLEAFLGWHEATGDGGFLTRAEEVIDLFASCFFDPENWTLGECSDAGRTPANRIGEFEPGHHFEWAWLIVDFVRRAGRPDLVAFARKLYATAVANGVNRATGLALGRVSTSGVPLDPVSRSWPQAEAIKAAIALDSAGGADLKPEIEERVGRLFAWHLDPAPAGLWIDRIGPDGEPLASEVPASILYHLVSALTAYLDYSADAAQ